MAFFSSLFPISFLFNTLLRLPFSSLCDMSLLRYCSSSLSHLGSLPHLPAFSNAQGFSALFSAFHPFHSSPLLVLSAPQSLPFVTLLLSLQHCTHFSAHFSTIFPLTEMIKAWALLFWLPGDCWGIYLCFLKIRKKGVSGEMVGSSLCCPRPRGRIETCDLLRKFLL